MKKRFYGIFSGIIAGVMIGALFSAASTEAAADTISVQARYIEKRVVVSGHIEQSETFKNNTLTILLSDKDNNDIAYINEAVIDDYGDYKHSFEFMGDKDIDSYTLKVKAGDKDVTDTAKSIGCFTDMIEAEAVKNNETSVEIGVKLINDYYMNQDYTMYAAAYSADNTLIDVNVFQSSLNSEDGEMRKFLKLNKNGRDISEVRLYAWDKENGIKPLGKVFAFGENNENKIKDTAEKTVYKRIEAETVSNAKSKNIEVNNNSFGTQNINYSRQDTYMCFENTDLTNVKSITALADTNRDNEYLELRIDGPEGELIGKLPLINSGEYAHGENVSYSLTYAGIKDVSGTHDLYIIRPKESTANFILEHFVLSSERLLDSGEDDEPFYSKEEDIKFSNNNKTAEYSFYGTGIDLITNLGVSKGKVTISIDGKIDKKIDLDYSETLSRTVYTKTGLPKWNHTIRIESESPIEEENISFKAYKRPIIVACVGDSITDGVGNIGGKHIFSWPAQLQRRLGTGYYVVDCGHNGSTTEGIFGFSQGKTALKLNADIVINALYTNDKEATYKDNPEKFKNNYKNTMDKLKASSPDARIYSAIPPCGSTAAVSWWQTKRAWTEELAKENNWPVIDLNYVLESHRDDGVDKTSGKDKFGFYFIDGTHPSAKGYSFITAAVKLSLPCPELLDKAALDNEINRLNELDTKSEYSHEQLKEDLDGLDESGNMPAGK